MPEPKYLIYDVTALDRHVFGIIHHIPPAIEDFESYAALGRRFQPAQFFRATAVSMYLSEEEARAAREKFRLGGAGFAELDISDARIHWSVPGPRSGHIDVWAPPTLLLECVLNCVEEA